MTWVWLAGIVPAWFAMPSPSIKARVVLAVFWPVVFGASLVWGAAMAIGKALSG